MTGEEVSVTFRDPLFLTARLQHNPIATCLATHVYYGVGMRLFSSLDLFYGRILKAVAMALLIPLIFLYARFRIHLSVPASVFSAVLAGLLPGVISFSWLATEFGLDLVAGFAGLLMLISPKPAFRLVGGAAIGLSMHFYGAGIVFLPLLFLEQILFVRGQRSEKAQRTTVLSLLLTLLVSLFPLLWWKNETALVAGGARPALDAAGANIRSLFRELMFRGNSYYYFSADPALSSSMMGILALVGAILSFSKVSQRWPLYLGSLTAVAVYAFSGGVIGVRRAVILVVFSALFAGCAVDELIRLPWGRGRRFGLAVAAALMACALALPVIQYGRLRQAYAQGRIRLPRDFQYATFEKMSMEQSFQLLVRRPELYQQVKPFCEHDRVFAVLYWLASRNNEPSTVFYSRGRFWEGFQGKYGSPR